MSTSADDALPRRASSGATTAEGRCAIRYITWAVLLWFGILPLAGILYGLVVLRDKIREERPLRQRVALRLTWTRHGRARIDGPGRPGPAR